MASVSTPQNDAQPIPQLLSVGETDKKRLLEVYVKRSLSLNDGSQCPRRKEHRSHKWVPIKEQKERVRKHSSDTSLNAPSQASISDEDVPFEPVLEKKKKSKKQRSLRRNDGSNASQKSNGKPRKGESSQISDALPTQKNIATNRDSNSKDLEPSMVEKKDKGTKKAKKPTVWKNFLSWFTKESSEKEQENQRTEEELPVSKPSSPQISCLPLPDHQAKSDISIRRSKSLKKKKSFKWRRSGDMSAAKSVEMVEHTTSYYEKVSEELEKIVHEVKDTPTNDNATSQPTHQNGGEVSQEEVIRRIIALIKQQGDLINDTLKENPTVCAYLDGFSYRSFQQMADQYVQSEVLRQPIMAPELVKFAFTLDFTARVANLHRQATGQIMGFGNQYLQDRFTHMSERHPHLTDVKAGEQKTPNFEQEFVSL